MTKITKGKDGRRAFSWIVKISVSELWVADGFDLDAERALAMIRRYLTCAYDVEVDAKVIDAPPRAAIRRAQGYPPHGNGGVI